MSKNLALLKQEFFDVKNGVILEYLIPVLEDFEKLLGQINDRFNLHLKYKGEK